MQAACEANPGTMAAVLGLPDEQVDEICKNHKDGVVVAANFNCPGQIVISGEVEAIDAICPVMKEAGARRALRLPVGGAFHSPLMAPAAEDLAKAINQTEFRKPFCPIYQNVTAKASIEPEIIRENLLKQLTAPVRWTQSVQNMIADGASEFYEFGPGDVLKGLIRKINPEAQVG
jgi:[acyl-carrier-protein] S-malonyltransferase